MINVKNFIKIFGFASVAGLGAFYSNTFDVKKNDESESLLNVIIVSRHGVRVILSHFFQKTYFTIHFFYSPGSYPIAYYQRVRRGDVFEILL
jgi:hypothetical protein